ncbi:MAG TPA: peptidoglycan-binding protein [Blastocatellia bacterium]|nr:peptidoglycan-binding protein [Blastocatellia bacterium]HMX26671.1 peptidoglycan-binding protein [Blastocatellia bacterium]HMY74034.1 peptidoglycan-binding protein [Blastocatellia bacterium]HMZ22850.1 peptidoglycan-binding protein [Blastocatellia bacterium]HNG28918.1 peptidoglycan-binding protein [Blastocatellia bacterium]
MPLTAIDAIRRIAPDAKSNYLEAIRGGDELFRAAGLTTPLRMAHFLAQALHETGGFVVLRESMNYRASRLIEIFGVGRHSAAVTGAEAAELAGKPEAIAERVYGLGNPRKARELGNTSPGDGFRYRGNGILQTTGRGNHKQTGQACGVDFEGNPDLVTVPEHALKPALHEWTSGNLNLFADRNDIRTITRKINGGLIGLEDRQSRFNQIWPLLKNDDQPDDASEAGAEDGDVKSLQEDLNTLGANPKLTVDGRYGPATREAVRDFQAIAGLTRDGIAGPVTLAAIKLRLDTIRAA